MNPLELAKLIVDTPPELRIAVIIDHEPLPAVKLAESLQQMCYEVWTDDPQKVSAIADVLILVAERTQNPEVRAYSAWTEAIRALVDGDLELCIGWIDRSEAAFVTIDMQHLAAKTQTSKLYALALLGRYDDAVDCGLKARAIFLSHNDLYSAGKIENNIGNLFARRDMYRAAEPYLESAHARFTQIDDQRQLAMVENCQAFVKMFQNEFRDAETIYRRALERSSINKLTITEAEIETSLSNLYLFEGKYDLALKFMERSRLKYEGLEMPNQSANCELEIADIYLELNLLPEAVSFYQKVEARFTELSMQAELARNSLSHARALLRLGETVDAACKLDLAENLYEKEGNLVAVGSVKLARAQMLFKTGELDDAEQQAELALAAFKHGKNLRLEMFAHWFRGEIWRVRGRSTDAEFELNATLALAKNHSKEVDYLCRVSLGKITGDEAHFAAAVDLVEDSRAGLASEELRTSFFADKVVPYNELVKINLGRQRFEDAFRWHERSRSRSMADSLYATGTDSQSDEKLLAIREELNWYYNRINRSGLSTNEERESIASLRKSVTDREKEYAEVLRRLQARGKLPATVRGDIDIDEFRSRLGDVTMVEFAAIDGRISAFVISKNQFTAFPHYVDEAEVNREITQFLFQIKTGRFIDRLSEENRAAALERLNSHGRRIYDLLIRPLGDLARSKRLVFAPAGVLNYLPFHALNDGTEYLVERAEISYAPSVAVLDRCLKMPPPDRQNALLVGIPDERTPLVEAEIETVGSMFRNSIRLFGADATVENIRRLAAGCGVVHLACHGKFRPDNPGFSSLVLYSEELTVNEIQNLRLENSIVALSSCESGLNEVVRGEELIGLTRAFFAAGASSLVLSLWRVDDSATHEMMKAFYTDLCSSKGVAEALGSAQRHLIDAGFHPYFWSPFIVSGRW